MFILDVHIVYIPLQEAFDCVLVYFRHTITLHHPTVFHLPTASLLYCSAADGLFSCRTYINTRIHTVCPHCSTPYKVTRDCRLNLWQLFHGLQGRRHLKYRHQKPRPCRFHPCLCYRSGQLQAFMKKRVHGTVCLYQWIMTISHRHVLQSFIVNVFLKVWVCVCVCVYLPPRAPRFNHCSKSHFKLKACMTERAKNNREKRQWSKRG